MLKGQHRLTLVKERVLRKKFWPEREEVTGNWRKLYYES
jgi:hypothetical protein